jgi:hypothetical protein
MKHLFGTIAVTLLCIIMLVNVLACEYTYEWDDNWDEVDNTTTGTTYDTILLLNEQGYPITDATITVTIADSGTVLSFSSCSPCDEGKYAIFSSDYLSYLTFEEAVTLEVTIERAGYVTQVLEYDILASNPCCPSMYEFLSGSFTIKLESDGTVPIDPPCEPTDPTQCLSDALTQTIVRVVNEEGEPVTGLHVEVSDVNTGALISLPTSCECDASNGEYAIYAIPEPLEQRFVTLEATFSKPGYETTTKQYHVTVSNPLCNACPVHIEYIFGETEFTIPGAECIDPFNSHTITVVDDFGALVTDAVGTAEVATTGEPIDLSGYPAGEQGIYTIFTDDQVTLIEENNNDPTMIYVRISKTGYEIIIREYVFQLEPTNPDYCFNHTEMSAGNTYVELSSN